MIAIGLGTMALIRYPGDTPSTPRSLDAITVSAEPAVVLPLSETEILALLDQRAEFGPLADAGRRTSCLAGLGYPASTRVLGARPVDIRGRPAVVLVLPGDSTRTLLALAVSPSCSSANTGLVADTTIRRP